MTIEPNVPSIMQTDSPEPKFDFGDNWRAFSRNALTGQKVKEAAESFRALCKEVDLKGRSFLDIGFGQGLGLLNAASSGAHTVGCEINAKCVDVLEQNRRFFPDLVRPIPTVVGSILDDAVLHRLREFSPTRGFAVVHSWGVLHHTGNMSKAIGNSASLVEPGGYLIIAIYNRHWSSFVWRSIKRQYVRAPRWLQRLGIAALEPVIYVAKWAVTFRNPLRQQRGMDFHYDVIDWVGGYPYEFASQVEIETAVTSLGFRKVRTLGASVPTGCNEFIFQRIE